MANLKEKNKESALLHKLGSCSKNMVQKHHLENLSEFLLHDVCSDGGFNIRKAAYLVHNPDFECLKGVAGYYHPESFDGGACWENPKNFTSHMQQAGFNQKVRSYNQSPMPHEKLSRQHMEELVDYLEIDDPAYHIWNSKHDNQGIFIFESENGEKIGDDHLLSFLHMFSFCPIF